MSKLQYYNYEGFGTLANRQSSYSQAVRVGDIIKCSGQAGVTEEAHVDKRDVVGQVELAFRNVEENLKDAGAARGWQNVYSVRSYHVSIASSYDVMVEQFRKWMPTHQPIWTCVGVTELAIPGMFVEIEVEAVVD
ncbi:hypothetical protein ACHAQH_004576 [Verticillium albo-atrum]